MESRGSTDPADTGAAASSGVTGSFDNVDGDDQCHIVDGADEVPLQQEQQEGEVRVQGHEQGRTATQRAPTTVSSGNDIGPSVSQVQTPERRGQVDLPPDSWNHPQANGPPRRAARAPARPQPQTTADNDDDQGWARWNDGRQAHQRVDHIHRWESDNVTAAGPWPAEQWNTQQWYGEEWPEGDWNENNWRETATYTR